jgi:16S rRNA (adenine1518-N6/adenine1519-N6)-dimethyltransferase
MVIVNPSETKAILRRYDIHLTKRLGQHFLIDANILDKEIAAAGLTPDDTVLEIGPGIGTLTEALAGHAGRVVAVEYDNRFISVLGETLKHKNNVEIVRGDAMEIDLGAFNANVMVANLPYNVGTAVLTRVLQKAPKISRIVVMLQKEVVARLAAGPGGKDYGVLSITAGCYATTSIVAEVKRNSFLPPPDVDSAIAVINRRPEPIFGADTPGFIAFVKTLFAARRKTIKPALTMGLDAISSEKAAAAVAKSGLEPSIRAETLSAEELYRLFRALGKARS